MMDTNDRSNPLPCMPTLTGVPVKIRRWAKVKEALDHSGWGRTKLYQLIAARKIETTKDGGTRLVDLNSIDSYWESQALIELKRAG